MSDSFVSSLDAFRIPHFEFWFFLRFFRKFLEDINPFCGAIDAPILDFW